MQPKPKPSQAEYSRGIKVFTFFITLLEFGVASSRANLPTGFGV